MYMACVAMDQPINTQQNASSAGLIAETISPCAIGLRLDDSHACTVALGLQICTWRHGRGASRLIPTAAPCWAGEIVFVVHHLLADLQPPADAASTCIEGGGPGHLGGEPFVVTPLCSTRPPGDAKPIGRFCGQRSEGLACHRNRGDRARRRLGVHPRADPHQIPPQLHLAAARRDRALDALLHAGRSNLGSLGSGSGERRCHNWGVGCSSCSC